MFTILNIIKMINIKMYNIFLNVHLFTWVIHQMTGIYSLNTL